MVPTTTEFHRLYQNLLRFKLTDNSDKIYNRVTRTKKVNSSGGGGAAGGGMRKRLKQLINTQPTNPISLLSTLHDMPLSPKWDNNVEYADYAVSDLPVFSSSMASAAGAAGAGAAAAAAVAAVGNVVDEENQPNNIVILKNSEYEKIKTSKYNLNDLKLLCGHYGIKKSGTKPDLVSRIYTHLKQSCLIVKIQRKFRKYISVKYRTLNGPAFLRSKQCVNDTDFYTFDTLDNIDPHNLFSFLDDDGKIYGFHIASIYNLIISSYPDITNPYNRNTIPLRVIQNVYEKLIFGSLLNIKVSVKLDDDDDDIDGEPSTKISPEKQEELFIVGLFQHINTLGNYSDSEWFTTLRRNDFMRFIRHIYDIWCYRANLSQDTKERICPPNGNPFMLNNAYVNINIIHLLTEAELKTFCVSIIDRMVMRGVNREDQCLGAFYVLATLTIVNQDARNALPWLYEAVL